MLDNYRWTKEIGCADGVYFGLVALALFAEGEFEQAQMLTDRVPSDPSKRLNVVKSALALRDGDSTVCVNEASKVVLGGAAHQQISVLVAEFEESDCTMVVQ